MLAIIVPYYKLTFFDETLQSLASQTIKLFKVYIGDYASTENPVELLDKYKGKLDFVIGDDYCEHIYYYLFCF